MIQMCVVQTFVGVAGGPWLDILETYEGGYAVAPAGDDDGWIALGFDSVDEAQLWVREHQAQYRKALQ